MGSMKINGSDEDLEQFARGVLEIDLAIEAPSPFERSMAWRFGGNSGLIRSNTLRSGISMTASRCWWDQPSGMSIDHAPTALEFVLSRGPNMRLQSSDGEDHQLGGGVLVVSQVKRPVRLVCDWDESSQGNFQDNLCLSISSARLGELLGTSVLPAPLRRIEDDRGDYPRDAQAMTPPLFRLLDEILHCDAKGLSRQLYLEAKGLEVMAAMIDQIEETERASPQLLPQQDVERLERARQILLARIETPPSLPELARHAGLNEVKLKSGFRALFGDSVFSYLRNHRMEEAHRLLRLRRYSVSEVALRVGYENPSKFAAAFRKRFGMSPSAVV